MKSKIKYDTGISGWIFGLALGILSKKLPLKKWFEFYQSQFDVVELNATFYRRFSNTIYKKTVLVLAKIFANSRNA